VAESFDSQSEQPIEIKDPWMAGILAWLIPGLGHFYQGRNAKGALYAICIMGTFLYGLYLGGSPEVGWGRAVYFSFRQNDARWPWLCQIGVGLPTVPMTLLQWKLEDLKLKPVLNGFMAPPALKPSEQADNNGVPAVPVEPATVSLAWINRVLPHYFELGTVYTMIAGLLNILAVYDATCGPVTADSSKPDDDNPDRPADPESELKK
jgi:TM2 domain-containing membrane protein YozV